MHHHNYQMGRQVLFTSGRCPQPFPRSQLCRATTRGDRVSVKVGVEANRRPAKAPGGGFKVRVVDVITIDPSDSRARVRVRVRVGVGYMDGAGVGVVLG